MWACTSLSIYVKNNETGEIKKFGINHFEEHTGIPPQFAREIARGIEKIDYELDEILIKIMNNWTLEDEGINQIPLSITVPNDIQDHWDYGLPLLNRQVNRLKDLLREFFKEQRRIELHQKLLEQKKEEKVKQEEYAKKRQAIRKKAHSFIKNQQDFNLKKSDQVGIMVYINDVAGKKFNASDVCEHLVKYHGANNSQFSSGKYTIFPEVCTFLEYLKSEGMIDFVEIKGNMDRVYSVLH